MEGKYYDPKHIFYNFDFNKIKEKLGKKYNDVKDYGPIIIVEDDGILFNVSEIGQLTIHKGNCEQIKSEIEGLFQNQINRFCYEDNSIYLIIASDEMTYEIIEVAQNEKIANQIAKEFKHYFYKDIKCIKMAVKDYLPKYDFIYKLCLTYNIETNKYDTQFFGSYPHKEKCDNINEYKLNDEIEQYDNIISAWVESKESFNNAYLKGKEMIKNYLKRRSV
ncbi:MAG: hypothetical protein ACOCP8_01245 [archaeon]